MADKPVFADPDNVPTRSINSVISLAWVGSIFDMTLGTVRFGVTPEGEMKGQTVIAARLRFDLEMARMIRDEIDAKISALSPPPDEKPN